MRTVNSSSRSERARETRRRMLESAQHLFLSRGYGHTTMAQIATDAKVAVQTLYYTFQTKGKLLIELVEVVGAGGDPAPIPVPQRAWFQEMMSAQSGQRVLALTVEHGTAIYERVAVLWPVLAEAAGDPDVASYWEGISSGRRNAQRGMVSKLADLGSLKPGLKIARATDLLVLLAGHEPYRAFVQSAGWPVADYRVWLFTTLVEQLLADTAVEREAIADLSFGALV